MWKTLLNAVLIGCILFGLVAFSYILFFKAIRPKPKCPYYVVLSSKSCRDLVAAAYAAKMKMSLLGDDNLGSILLLDCGLDDVQRLCCQTVCRENSGIRLVTQAEIKDIFYG